MISVARTLWIPGYPRRPVILLELEVQPIEIEAITEIVRVAISLRWEWWR